MSDPNRTPDLKTCTCKTDAEIGLCETPCSRDRRSDLPTSNPIRVPEWDECKTLIDNDGSGCFREVTPLDRFVYEYDDADRERSKEFMLRLREVVAWVQEQTLSGEGTRAHETRAPLFPPDEPWPASMGDQCPQYWGVVERRCQLTKGHEPPCYFCIPAYAIRTDIQIDSPEKAGGEPERKTYRAPGELP